MTTPHECFRERQKERGEAQKEAGLLASWMPGMVSHGWNLWGFSDASGVALKLPGPWRSDTDGGTSSGKRWYGACALAYYRELMLQRGRDGAISCGWVRSEISPISRLPLTRTRQDLVDPNGCPQILVVLSDGPRLQLLVLLLLLPGTGGTGAEGWMDGTHTHLHRRKVLGVRQAAFLRDDCSPPRWRKAHEELTLRAATKVCMIWTCEGKMGVSLMIVGSGW